MLLDATRMSEISACVANKADQDINSLWGGQSAKNCSVSAVFKMSVLRGYVENGTVITEGFVASATLDLSSFSGFGDLVGNVVIDGVVVGTIPDDTYADIDALIDAYVTAIEANPIGYQAVNNGDGTITVSAPNQGSQANGFVITIQINPTFVRLSQIDYDNREWRQPIHINDQSSALFGHTIIAARASGGVNPFYLEDIFDHAIVQTVDVDFNAGAAGLVHRPDDDTIFVGAFQGSGRLRQFVNTFASSQQITLSGVNGINWAVYNTFNNCLYFAAPSANNKVVKVDPTGVQTLISSITGVIKLAVDDSTGTVWAVGTNSLWRINPTTNVATAIPTVGEVPVSISYCNAGSGSMFVAFTTPSVVRRYNLDGTVLTSTFYSLASLSAVIYSSVFNVVFAGTSSITHVIKMDGTLKNTIADGSENYVEDIARSEVIGFRDSGLGNIGYVNFFGLGTDGTDVFDGALEDGVDPVLMEQEDQCLTEDEINTAYQEMNKICLTCHTLSDITNPTPVGSNTIYYGNSATGALTASGIEGLTAITAISYPNTYVFASSGGTYKYIAYPSNLGLAATFMDANTGLPVSMSTMYTVIINYITYNVYRTYNLMGGALSITVTS